MATNTLTNVGIRRDCGGDLGMRNFEPLGGQLYSSAREDLEWGGVLYDSNEVIPFDASASGVEPFDRYSDDVLMERYFNSGWVVPTV